MNPIAIDFETYYDASYSVSDMIAEEYCRDDRFDAYLISAWDGKEGWVGNPLEFNWDSLCGRTVLCHNVYFDLTVWQELARRHGVPVNYGEIHCTANLTSFLCNRRSLADAVDVLFGQYVSKGARSDMKGKHWSELNEAEQQRMRDYAMGDVEWTWKLWDKFSGQWPEVERKLSQLTIDQGMRGVHIDRDRLTHYLSVVYEAIDTTKKAIPWVEEFAPTSPQAIAMECRKVGIPCPPLKTEDAEGFEEWERKYGPQYDWIPAVSSLRSLTKVKASFELVKRRLRPDDTMPFSLKYFGAHTGRWAGDAKVNMQNPRKSSILINERGLMESDDARCRAAFNMQEEEGKFPAWVKDEINFRYLITPRPGKKMIVCDLSQIEARVLAYIAGDTEFCKAVASGITPYIAHAKQTMGWQDGWTKKSHPELYALAKARVLGLGYGCGWEKFITVAKTIAGLDITKDDPEFEEVEDPISGETYQKPGYGKRSREIVQDYRKRHPKQTALWKRLDGEFTASAARREDFRMRLPSGRVMTYRNTMRQTQLTQDKDGKPVSKYVYTADVGGVLGRKIFYGGKLTENLIQAISRDVFGHQMVRIHYEHNLTTLFSCHDELILEVDQHVSAKGVEALMSQTPEWLSGCPIGAEAKEVERYCK